MEQGFLARVQSNPVVAAVRDVSHLDRALQSPSEVIFLLQGNIFNVRWCVERVQAAGKEIFIHFDLIEGFSKDPTAVNYVRDVVRPNGIITTKGNLVKIARELGLFAIQRLFILDSLSLDSGIKSVLATHPDAVEILPGLIPRVIKQVRETTKVPVIAGGLIETKDDVVANLKAGAIGVSVSKESVWYL